MVWVYSHNLFQKMVELTRINCVDDVIGPSESRVRTNPWKLKFGRFSLVASAVAVAGVLSLAPARTAEPAEGGLAHGAAPKTKKVSTEKRLEKGHKQ